MQSKSEQNLAVRRRLAPRAAGPCLLALCLAAGCHHSQTGAEADGGAFASGAAPESDAAAEPDASEVTPPAAVVAEDPNVPLNEAVVGAATVPHRTTRRIKRPPRRPREDQPPQPAPADVWVPGYWWWSPPLGRYVWVSGAWREPPPYHTWYPGAGARRRSPFWNARVLGAARLRARDDWRAATSVSHGSLRRRAGHRFRLDAGVLRVPRRRLRVGRGLVAAPALSRARSGPCALRLGGRAFLHATRALGSAPRAPRRRVPAGRQRAGGRPRELVARPAERRHGPRQLRLRSFAYPSPRRDASAERRLRDARLGRSAGADAAARRPSRTRRTASERYGPHGEGPPPQGGPPGGGNPAPQGGGSITPQGPGPRVRRRIRNPGPVRRRTAVRLLSRAGPRCITHPCSASFLLVSTDRGERARLRFREHLGIAFRFSRRTAGGGNSPRSSLLSSGTTPGRTSMYERCLSRTTQRRRAFAAIFARGASARLIGRNVLGSTRC